MARNFSEWVAQNCANGQCTYGRADSLPGTGSEEIKIQGVKKKVVEKQSVEKQSFGSWLTGIGVGLVEGIGNFFGGVGGGSGRELLEGPWNRKAGSAEGGAEGFRDEMRSSQRHFGEEEVAGLGPDGQPERRVHERRGPQAKGPIYGRETPFADIAKDAVVARILFIADELCDEALGCGAANAAGPDDAPTIGGGTNPLSLIPMSRAAKRAGVDDVLDAAADGAAAEARAARVGLKRPSGVSDADWNAKLDALKAAAEAGTAKVVHKPVRNGGPQRQARRSGSVAPGHDADHALDLQFGGADDISNIVSTDARVNRSVGAQGQQRMQYPDGTPIEEFYEE